MKKKLLALVLATSMVIGGSMTVCAADYESGKSAEITGTGETTLPTIEVEVPTSLAFVVNPFSIGVEVGEGDAKTTLKTQIVCAGAEIANKGETNVEVLVSELKVAAVEGVTFTEAAITAKDTTKSMFLFLEVATKLTGAYKANTANMLAIGTTASEGKARVAVIPAAKTDKSGTLTPSTTLIGIGGSVVSSPVDEDGEADSWTGEEEFTVSFKLDFTPTMATK